MSGARYQYAYLENNELVSIIEIKREAKKDHKYRCLQCGNELIANIGSYKIPYFSHKAKCDCNGESYLHKLAKIKIKQAFDAPGPFFLNFRQTVTCNHSDCNYHDSPCSECNDIKEDLKKYYDVCCIEKGIQISGDYYIADILLSSSETVYRPPLAIEIKVTHSCTDQKRASGLKIIEVAISDEQYIESICLNRMFDESDENINLINGKKHIYSKLCSKIIRIVHKKKSAGQIVEVPCDDTQSIIDKNNDFEANIIKYREYYRVQYLRYFQNILGWRDCKQCSFYDMYTYGEIKERHFVVKIVEECSKARSLYSEYCKDYNTGNKQVECKLPEFDFEIVKNDRQSITRCIGIAIIDSFTYVDYLIEKCKKWVSEITRYGDNAIVYLGDYRGESSVFCEKIQSELGIKCEVISLDNKSGNPNPQIITNGLLPVGGINLGHI